MASRYSRGAGMSGNLDAVAVGGAVLLRVEPREHAVLLAREPAVGLVGLREMAVAPAPAPDRAGAAILAPDPAPGTVERHPLGLVAGARTVEQMPGAVAGLHPA